MLRKLAWCGAVVIAAGILWAVQPEPAAPKAPATRPVGIATLPASRPATRPVYRDIGVKAFERLWRQEKYAVLDVRTKREFDAGHVPGAINIDVNDPAFEKKVAALKKERPYLVNCRTGARSARACDKMSGMGFKELYNLEGGIVAWQKAEKEVTTE